MGKQSFESWLKTADTGVLKLIYASVYDDTEYDFLKTYMPELESYVLDAFYIDLVYQELRNRIPGFWFWDVYIDE